MRRRRASPASPAANHESVPSATGVSSAWFDSLAAAVSDGIWVIDARNTTLFVNEGAAKMLDRTPEEIVGRSILEFAYEQEPMASDLGRVQQQGQASPYEWQLRRKYGAPLQAAFLAAPIFDSANRRDGTLLTMTEVSEKKSDTADLQASERRYRLLVENSLDCIVLVAHDGRILYASPSVKTLLGYSEAEFVGTNAVPLIHPEDRRAIEQAFVALLQEPGGKLRAEFRCRRSDHTWRWIEAAATNLIGEPSVDAVIASFRDITDRKDAEENLAYIIGRSRCLPWQAIVLEHVSPEGVRWYEWKSLEFDDRAAQRFIPLEPLPGESYATAWYRCKDPADQRDIDRSAAEAMRNRQPSYTHEFRCQGADGKRYWVHEQVNIEPVSETEWRLAGLCFDITERRRLEENLREHAAELAAANRSKDEFLAMLAHELRNPLAAMNTAIHLLMGQPSHSQLEARARAVIDRQVRHMIRHVNDLLDVSRLDRGKIQIAKERLNLVVMVRECVEDYRAPLDEAGASLSVDLPADAVWVDGDRTRLCQVIANLLDNAAKFTRHGDSVRVALESSPGIGQAVITVSDTGAGIEPALLPKIFEAFTQARQNLERGRGGLGMGLAMVKGLIELHGGSVQAYSEGPGYGSSFTIQLPLALVRSADGAEAADTGEEADRAAEGDALPDEKSPEPAGSRKKRILIVEDNRDAAETLSEVLALFGHQVEIAYDGLQGLNMAREYSPDVVLCDLGLPGMDGWEVARQLRGDPAMGTVRLLAVTGYGRAEDVNRSREAGFDE
ncbi:MAG: PAS domain S-box protein, partial [Chloroflexi bacterium]|nr:PAS domain S-box protein [Chloroflexota bacterium]